MYGFGLSGFYGGHSNGQKRPYNPTTTRRDKTIVSCYKSLMSALANFEHSLKALPLGQSVAAGVSGGPDSMAMLFLLSQWARKNGVHIHAITVDHGLRTESAIEAKMVESFAKNLRNVTHRIVKWEGNKPATRILEEARAARYALMAGVMHESGAKHLFVAHHRDDQAETFLIRLAKGSGLDGLSGMRVVQETENGITLVRPLLNFSKEDLVALCEEQNIPYARDPSNENEKYLRPRLRAAQGILEEEGLSAKRLATTAKRLARARSALEESAGVLFEAALIEKREDGFIFDINKLRASHEELVLRVLLKAMDELRPDAAYAPRMEKLENLLERFMSDPAFNGATLGGCIFALEVKNARRWVGKE